MQKNVKRTYQRSILSAVSFLILFIVIIPELPSQNITDAEVKAALLFKIPIYIKWPGNLLADQQNNFVCCILGNDRICQLMEEFDGEKLNDKTIRIKNVKTLEGITDCHMLFVGASERKNLRNILKITEEKHILTIGDMVGFAKSGGIINFIRKDDSIHFEINPKAGERTGLKISSKLLRLATIIEE